MDIKVSYNPRQNSWNTSYLLIENFSPSPRLLRYKVELRRSSALTVLFTTGW